MLRVTCLLCSHIFASLLFQIALLCLVAHPAWAHHTGEVYVHFGVSVVNGTTALLAAIFAILTGTLVYRQIYFYTFRLADREQRRHEPSY